MYIRCYRSRATSRVKEQLWTIIGSRGWISDRLDSTLFYIPEDRLSLALLADDTLTAEPLHDYIL